MKVAHESIVEQFLHTVSGDEFGVAAEAILRDIDDLETLATCAELAIQRQYGGAYYQALLWARVAELMGGNSTARKQFAELCRKTGVEVSAARKHAILGEAIDELENRGVGTNHLKRAHESVLRNSQRRKADMVEYLIFAERHLSSNQRATSAQIHSSWCSRNGSIKTNLDIIKPSDWWAFGRPKWQKENDFPGSIPGEIYANALYYFAPTKGVAVDVMAGSGMLKRVYDDRALWQKDIDFNLDIRLFDLSPRRSFIERHDARQPLPILADWIFADPPYFGQSQHLYEGELSGVEDYRRYIAILGEVIDAMALSLNPRGRFCLLLPKWSGIEPSDPNHNLPQDTLEIAERVGLRWIDFASVSRGRQQEPSGARMNARAKRQRRMRSDTCILNIFEKG